jgi:CheY-like chemotaxis protein
MNRKKILVVDDNLVIVKGLSLKLESQGYTVFTAGDGSTAIQLVRSENPDLLILDINFPADVDHGGGLSWDGFGILQWLERINKDWRKPVIIITGEEGEDSEARARAAGAVALLRKPLNLDELLAIIRRELGEPPPPAPASA